MKRHLNTLFITTQDTWLSKDGECVEIRLDSDLLGRIPLHTLQSIVCFGRVSCSQFLLGHCAELGITVSWYTEYGRYLASMQGPTTGNVLLRRAQYRLSDSSEGAANMARCFTIGKISNCRTVLLRQARSSGDARLALVIDDLAQSLHRLRQPVDLDTVRGIEGNAARCYFGAFDGMISPECRNKGLLFGERSRRPPLNEVNCLLSFLYALLMNDVKSALDGVGLDPAVGFLHRERPGRASLALDVMEEFRPYLADRLALTLINRQQVGKKDFVRTEAGGFALKEKSRKEILAAWQSRKQEEVEHPFLRERMPVGLLFFIQARLLARCIRGDIDAYPPFSMR